MLWELKKIWYRIYQRVFKVAMCFMDWSEPQLLEGAGSILKLPEFIKSKGVNKVLVVTDKGLMSLNLLDPLFKKLEEVGVEYVVYDGVQPNPTIPNIEECKDMYVQNNCQGIIAFGGGSSMDCAKAAGARVVKPKQSVRAMRGQLKVHKALPPFFAVPTTAGTAAEVTINYVITDEEKKRKFVCVDPHDIPVVAIIDAKMMSSMPKGLTASTGMDALTHAIEGYTTLGAWELTDMMHLKAIEIISRSLRKAVENDPQGREDMALGQYIAGMGFSNVGLGVVHGMAHPLGAFYDTPHGIANAVLLPYVMEYNAEYTGEKFKYIAEAMGIDTTGMSQAEYRAAAVNAVKQLSKDVGIPEKLHEIGVKEEDLQALSESAFADVCTGGNPRPCTVESILGIYKTAF